MPKIILNLCSTIIIFLISFQNCYALANNKDVPIEIIKRSPVGDADTPLYQAISNLFLTEKPLPSSEAESFIKHERDIQQTKDMKPYYAGVMEGENSHLLYALCKYNPYCIDVGLYDHNGIAFALASTRLGLTKFLKTEEVKGILNHDLIMRTNDKLYNPLIDTIETTEKGSKATYFYVTYVICKPDVGSSAAKLCTQNNNKNDIIGYLNYTNTRNRPKATPLD